PPAGRRGRVLSRAEDEVVADGVGERAHVARGAIGPRIVVDPDVAEVASEAHLEVGARACVERAAPSLERFADTGRRAAPRRLRRRLLARDRLLLLVGARRALALYEAGSVALRARLPRARRPRATERERAPESPPGARRPTRPFRPAGRPRRLMD